MSAADSIAESVAFEALRRRVDEVERRLAELTAVRYARGVRDWQMSIREEIAKIAVTGEFSKAKCVLKELARSGIEPLPKLRTVQHHLRALRGATGGVAAGASST